MRLALLNMIASFYFQLDVGTFLKLVCKSVTMSFELYCLNIKVQLWKWGTWSI